MLVTVDGHEHLKKDMNTGAIINVDPNIHTQIKARQRIHTLESKINITVGLIATTNRNRTKLEAENKRLEADNERMKKAIADNETRLEDNKKKIENLMKQSAEQNESLNQLRTKTGELK